MPRNKTYNLCLCTTAVPVRLPSALIGPSMRALLRFLPALSGKDGEQIVFNFFIIEKMAQAAKRARVVAAITETPNELTTQLGEGSALDVVRLLRQVRIYAI